MNTFKRQYTNVIIIVGNIKKVKKNLVVVSIVNSAKKIFRIDIEKFLANL